jgi:hypothetical protein
MPARDPFEDWLTKAMRRERLAWGLIALGVLAILATAATLIWRG